VDGADKTYNGANKYVMHFPKGQLPPAKGFWSLTMYDSDYFFVSNPINRYSISARQNLNSIRTARPNCTCKRTRRAKTGIRTGCPRQQAISS
jgi:hypothetical protein